MVALGGDVRVAKGFVKLVEYLVCGQGEVEGLLDQVSNQQVGFTPLFKAIQFVFPINQFEVRLKRKLPLDRCLFRYSNSGEPLFHLLRVHLKILLVYQEEYEGKVIPVLGGLQHDVVIQFVKLGLRNWRGVLLQVIVFEDGLKLLVVLDRFGLEELLKAVEII
mgnify:CR=1 FL=1